MPIVAQQLDAARHRSGPAAALRVAFLLAALAALALLAALSAAPARAKVPYPGMKLNPPGARIAFSHSGPAFVRIYCPGQVFGYPHGFCTGTMTLKLGGRRIAAAPVSSSDYDRPSMQVNLPAWFRRLVRRSGPQRVRVVMRTHDLQGLYRTTTGHVTIAAPGRGIHRGAGAPALPHVSGGGAPRPHHIPSPGWFPGAPRFAGSWGNPRGVLDSRRPGQFGDGRQVLGGNRQAMNPAGVLVDGAGNVWAADTDNNRVQEFNAFGGFVRTFGAYGFDPGATRPVLLSRFNGPSGMAMVRSTLYVVDSRNSRIMAWNVAGRPRPIRRIGRRGSYRGRFTAIAGIAVSANQRQILVIDQGNFRIQRFSLSGHYLGSFGHFGTRRGGFQLAWAIAIAPDGRVFVLDQMRNRVLVFSAGGRFLTEFGRTGIHRGELNRPRGLAIDPQGRLLIADTGNRRVDRYSLDGQFLDSFGYGPYTSSSRAVMDNPSAIAVSPISGLIYVADSGNVYPSGFCGRFRQPQPDPCRPRRISVYAP